MVVQVLVKGMARGLKRAKKGLFAWSWPSLSTTATTTIAPQEIRDYVKANPLNENPEFPGQQMENSAVSNIQLQSRDSTVERILKNLLTIKVAIYAIKIL